MESNGTKPTWGAGFFSFNNEGQVVVDPAGNNAAVFNLLDLVQEVLSHDVPVPVLFRFPQIIETQIKRIKGAFSQAIKDNGFEGEHLAVFPYKVNQQREFIDYLVQYGRSHKYGVEVGSKSELFAAISYALHPDAKIICNGFKDSAYIEMIFLAKALGKNIVLVIEGIDELETYCQVMKKVDALPEIGIRIKLGIEGTGIWGGSVGRTSKFGLTACEIIEALDYIKLHHLENQLTLIHYHIGSQVPDIQTVKNAVTEAVRVYVQLWRLEFNIKYLNIGGGIGVDYDGTRSSTDHSANYSIQEFANDVIFIIGELCMLEKVPQPNVITESGRFLAAYHSVVVTDVREIMGNENRKKGLPRSDKKFKHLALSELCFIYNNLSSENLREYLHDTIQHREDMHNLFKMGFLSLREKAEGERFIDGILDKAVALSAENEIQASEQTKTLLRESIRKRYLANFSIFNSIPDYWALKQLFPIFPLSKNIGPTNVATIVDITCDSEGSIDQFIEHGNCLELPEFSESNKFLAIFLVGAYQESLSMRHNLLGNISEAHVVLEKGKTVIKKLIKGSTIQSILFEMNYACHDLIESFNSQIEKLGDESPTSKAKKLELQEKFEEFLKEYTYLRPSK